MESKGIEARSLIPPRACTAESDACMTLESAGSSVPNATFQYTGISSFKTGAIKTLDYSSKEDMEISDDMNKANGTDPSSAKLCKVP